MLNGVVMQSKLVNTPMQSVKEEEWINLREGCYRLASLSQELIRFLQNLHVQGVTVEPPCSQSIGRYINIWLPLVAELQINNSRSVMLLPPPDVAWLWYCHRLATEKYDQYVTNRFGKLVEANPPFEFQHEESNDVTSSFTRDQWALRYPDAPFFHVHEDCGEVVVCADVDGEVDFDFVGAALRQREFLWHISSPFYQDESFLSDGAQRYFKFLKLSAQLHAIVPTFQIELMWRTHILSSLTNYNDICISLRGSKFDHDQFIADQVSRTEAKLLFRQTRQFWNKAYGTEYVVEGGMHRGETPSRFFRRSWTPVCVAIRDSCRSSTSGQSGCLEEKWNKVQSQWRDIQASRNRCAISASPRATAAETLFLSTA